MVYKVRKQGSNNKGKCNSPIFSIFVGYYVIRLLNIGLLHFPLLIDPCILVFYTTRVLFIQLSHKRTYSTMKVVHKSRSKTLN